MTIKLTSKITPTNPMISKMTFNGSSFLVYSVNNRKIASYPAISGLPPNAPQLVKIISKGRTDLKESEDYTQPKYQNVKDVGPIQEDKYTLSLKPQMPYDKSAKQGGGPGWGEGGWILTEHFLAKVGNIFGGRFGFFLHHDGGNKGTSRCIGISSRSDFKSLRQLLLNAQKSGQKSVLIEVAYP